MCKNGHGENLKISKISRKMLKNTSPNREKSTQNRTCNVQRATLHVQKGRCNAKMRPGRLQEASGQLVVYHFDDHFGPNGRSKADSGSTLGSQNGAKISFLRPGMPFDPQKVDSGNDS